MKVEGFFFSFLFGGIKKMFTFVKKYKIWGHL